MRIIACLALHDVCAHEMVVKGLVPHMWTALLGTSWSKNSLRGPGIAQVGGSWSSQLKSLLFPVAVTVAAAFVVAAVDAAVAAVVVNIHVFVL